MPSLAEIIAPWPVSHQAMFLGDLYTRFADRALRNGDSVGLFDALRSAKECVTLAHVAAHLEQCDGVEQCDGRDMSHA